MTLIEKTMDVLKKQGLLPVREDNCIMFKYQMAGYLYTYDKDDEDFYSMYLPFIFEVDQDNELDVLRAVNSVNNVFKVVKLTVNDRHVWVCCEEKLSKEADIDEVVPFSISMLYLARKQFFEELKKL